MSVKASKKRKRDSGVEADTVFTLAEALPSASGPVLVNYPALQGPESIAFQRYSNKKIRTTGEDEGNAEEENMLVVGETEEMEFVSNAAETKRAANAGCKYLVAVYDRAASSLTVLPTQKTPYILTRTVKNLKSAPLTVSTPLQYMEAKTALGEAFGTKKAKAQLRAMLRNRVDVNAMEGVMDHLQHGIDKGAASLLTKDEAEEAADSHRLIPPFDASATDTADVYPLHGIIPEVEWKALSISSWEEVTDIKAKTALLPYKASDWIFSHIKGISGKLSKSQKKQLKIVLYVSAMFAFRKTLHFNKKGAGVDNDQLSQKMTGIPTVITDSLLTRFTEALRGSTSRISTSGTELNLLSHLFALCLKADRFATDTSVLAHDLSMPVQRINQIFKSLGCQIRTLNDRERTQLGLPDSAAHTKYATLTAPVTFPKARTMKRNAPR